ncbi:MAG: hypothetical protein ACYDCK_06755 [Thermoplasmatota archaeon]
MDDRDRNLVVGGLAAAFAGVLFGIYSLPALGTSLSALIALLFVVLGLVLVSRGL